MRLHQNYKASYYVPSTYFKLHLYIVAATTFTSRFSISIYCTHFCLTVDTSSIQWNKLWFYSLLPEFRFHFYHLHFEKQKYVILAQKLSEEVSMKFLNNFQ